jgi:hypothetical protein
VLGTEEYYIVRQGVLMLEGLEGGLYWKGVAILTGECFSRSEFVISAEGGSSELLA